MNWLDDMEERDPAYGRVARHSTHAPIGDAAREATAQPYIGRHRRPDDSEDLPFIGDPDDYEWELPDDG